MTRNDDEVVLVRSIFNKQNNGDKTHYCANQQETKIEALDKFLVEIDTMVAMAMQTVCSQKWY